MADAAGQSRLSRSYRSRCEAVRLALAVAESITSLQQVRSGTGTRAAAPGIESEFISCRACACAVLVVAMC